MSDYGILLTKASLYKLKAIDMNSAKSLSPVKTILFTCVITMFFSCSQNASREFASYGGFVEHEVMLGEPPSVGGLMMSPASEASVERKLIKEGQLTFETKDLLHARSRIDSAVRTHQGYISSEKENKYGDRLENTLVIRVPFRQFDQFIGDAIKGVERLDHKDIRIRDVTEEFLDIQARLRTKKDLEQRYRDLLAKANSVSEILEVEKQIGALRADIESIEGRLHYLNDQSLLSTITITFYKSTPTSITYGNRFAEGFSNGWSNLMLFIVGLINIWPFLLILTGCAFLVRLWWRKRKAGSRAES